MHDQDPAGAAALVAVAAVAVVAVLVLLLHDAVAAVRVQHAPRRAFAVAAVVDAVVALLAKPDDAIAADCGAQTG